MDCSGRSGIVLCGQAHAVPAIRCLNNCSVAVAVVAVHSDVKLCTTNYEALIEVSVEVSVEVLKLVAAAAVVVVVLKC